MAKGAEALFAAIEGGDLDEVRRLVSEDPALASTRDPRGISAVLAATYQHRDDVAAVVLEAQPELDVFDAAGVGDVERLRSLLDADPGLVNQLSADGFPPLGLASYFGRTEAVRLLLDRGADAGAVAQNPMAVQALHAAVAGRHLEVVKALVAAGADVNATQHGGWRPLIQAAAHGDGEIAEVLLAAGADPALGSDEGKTAVSMAEDNGHTDLAERLKGLSRRP